MSVRKRRWTTAAGVEQQAWCVDYTDTQGNRRLRTFATKKEARDFAATARVEVGQGTHVVDSESILLTEAAEEWVEAVKRGRNDHPPAEASTLRQCRYHVDRYIAPSRLGRVKLSQLTKGRVMAFKDDLLAKISRPLARKVLTSLKGILSEAQDRGRITVNVASRVKIGNGSREREDVVIPEKADLMLILAKLDELAAQPSAWRRWRALIATAAHTGFRASELRGLPWEAVDLKHGRISVNQRADEKGKIGPPKSKAGYRTVSIPAHLVSILRTWKLEAPKGALVFGNGVGNPESLANIFNRAWKPIQLAAGVADPKRDDKGNVLRDDEGRPIMEPRLGFHSLRHFHASLLIHDDANPKDIMVEMGHSSIKITFDTYGHLFKDGEAVKRAAERAERLALA